MPYRLATLFAFLATTSALASLVWTHSSLNVRPKVKTTASLAREENPIDAMNQTVQKRFHTLTEFGLARMPTVHSAVRSFRPETALEKALVADLERKGWEVSLYLVGREALATAGSKIEEKLDGWEHRREIDGPLVLTEETNPKAHPSAWELREFGRKALINADLDDSFTTTSGPWKIEARPVRADRQACLKCHASEKATADPTIWKKQGQPLRVGDALGVAPYLYARNPK